MNVVIIGGGAAGLFAGWLLRKEGIEVTILEASDHVGGLSRSFVWHDFTCDLGTHRLFTTDEATLRAIMEITPLVRHSRRSQLYFQGQWLHDPVNIPELLLHSSFKKAVALLYDYLRPSSIEGERSFDDFVEKRYGETLNALFFRPYTQKLFKVPTSQISYRWAESKVRIAGFLDFLRESNKKKFYYFYYPVEGGFGAILRDLEAQLGNSIQRQSKVIGFRWQGKRITAVQYTYQGETKEVSADHVISTLPLSSLAKLLGIEASLTYRTVNFVYLWLNKPRLTENHWLYFIDEDIHTNRMVEFKNLSPVSQPSETTIVCAEVTGDFSDKQLVEGVISDLHRTRLLKPDEEVLDTMVIPYPFAYPIYRIDYNQAVSRVLQAIGRFENLTSAGRAAEFQHYELDDVFRRVTRVVYELTSSRQKSRQRSVKMTNAEYPVVYSVILTYNHYDDTEECLHSLQKSTYPNLKVLVVDNASTDQTPQKIREHFPTVEIIENQRNLGVPWGYNVGISYALRQGADYILLLNNDTVLAPQTVDALVEAARQQPDVGIFVPKILYYDDDRHIWAVGGRHRKFPPAHVLIGRDQRSDLFNEPIDLEYAMTCALLIPRQTFEQVGLLDPGYFFYFDDWDFSQRVRNAGLRIRFVPTATIWHKASKTTGATPKAFFWRTWGMSSARFYRRHSSPISAMFHIGYILLRETLKGNAKMLPAFLTGVKEGYQTPLGEIPAITDIHTDL